MDRSATSLSDPVRWLGRGFLETVHTAGRMGIFLAHSIILCFVPPYRWHRVVERIHFLGNTAFAVARRALLGRGARLRMELLAGRMTNFDLSLEPGYMERYVSSLFLPHTDLSLFPSVTEELVSEKTT